MSKSELETGFLRLWEQVGIMLPAPEREYRFHPTRRWRFDFAWPEVKVAVEIHGGIWSGGRHTRGKGLAKDCEKHNAATKLGWRVLYYTSKDMHEAPAQAVMDAAGFVREALRKLGE